MELCEAVMGEVGEVGEVGERRWVGDKVEEVKEEAWLNVEDTELRGRGERKRGR